MLITETIKPQQTSSFNGDAKLVSPTKNKVKEFSFLKQITLRKVSFWDFTSNVLQAEATKHNFELVRLGDLIVQRKGFFTIDDEQEYKRCKVQLYARGVILRDIVKGDEIKTKKQQLCKKDDFLVAEIDAKVGGYGIVPNELENAVVSSHYYLYEIDTIKLLPDFLGLYVKTEEFAKQVKATGSTNYASIRPAQVLEYQIPLPPIAVQEKLVAAYNAKMLQAAQFEAQAKDLEQEIETYLLKELGIKIQQTEKKDWKGFSFLQSAKLKELSRWDTWALGKDLNSLLHKNLTLRDVTIGEPQYGANSKATKKATDCRYIRITDINEDGSLNDEFVSAEKFESQYLLKENDLLIARSGATVGKTFLYKESFGKAIYAGYLVRYKINSEIIQPAYLFMFTKSSIYKHWIKSNQRISAQPNINGQEFLNSIVILPPLKIQNKIVKHINSLKAKIKALKIEAKDLRIKAKSEFESELFEM